MDIGFLLVVLLGLIFDYTNGFHDAANVVSTLIATRVLTALKAVILAALANLLGALLSSSVALTVAAGLVSPEALSNLAFLSYGLLGAISWNILTWYFGIPSSSSAALIGGVVGVSFFAFGAEVVLWKSLIFKVFIPMILAPIFGFLVSFILVRFSKPKKKKTSFKGLQLFSSLLVALSHGMNDAQKSMGIITLALVVGKNVGGICVPLWVILSCALVMALGTLSGGMRIIRTVGYKITFLDLHQGSMAQFATASVLLSGSYLGMPLSSTHIIVGAVTGSGAAKKKASVRWSLIRKVLYMWVISVPMSAIFAILFSLLGKFFFSSL